MISCTRVNSAQASNYYTVDDYYLSESIGTWQGLLTNDLKIKEFTFENFTKLVHGKSPNNDFEISKGGKDNKHTAGVDLTFSPSKSVSIAALVLGDDQIIEAHNKAVSQALKYVEDELLNVRKKINGVVTTLKTDNMMAAKFNHVSSRSLDPQLHTHCLIMNVTNIGSNQYRALDYKQIMKSKELINREYNNILSIELMKLGYKVEFDKKNNLEISGINENVKNKFSKRSTMIEKEFERLKLLYPNVHDSKLKEFANLNTREKKENKNIDELKNEWKLQLKSYDLSIDKLKSVHQEKINEYSPKDAIKFAIRDLTTNEILITEHEILKKSLEYNKTASVEELRSELRKNENICVVHDKITTKELYCLEKRIYDTVEAGKNRYNPINSNIESQLAKYEKSINIHLTTGQKKLVYCVNTFEDRFLLVQGDAGTGKTTALKALNDLNSRYELIGLSVTGKAVDEIKQASNIESYTVAKFVSKTNEIDQTAESKPRLYIIDEASMLGVKQFNKILDKTNPQDRFLLIGDTKQLQSIEAGKVFQTLQESGSVSVVHMDEILRQSKDTKEYEVAKSLAKYEVNKAINILEKNSMITVIKDDGVRENQIVNDFAKSYKDSLILSKTNESVNNLNKLARHELLKNGLICNTKEVEILQKKSTTNSSIRDIHAYRIGETISTDNFTGQIANIDKQNDLITLQSHTRSIIVNIQDCESITKYNNEQIMLGKGDKIMFTRNDSVQNVRNGQLGIVKSIKDNQLIVESNGKNINIDLDQYKFINYGYALTSYKSQGATTNNVYINADSSTKFNEQYVNLTRAKKTMKIYTNDITKFKKDINKSQEKTSIISKGY